VSQSYGDTGNHHDSKRRNAVRITIRKRSDADTSFWDDAHSCALDHRAWRRWTELSGTVDAQRIDRGRCRVGVSIHEINCLAYTVPNVKPTVSISVFEVLQSGSEGVPADLFPHPDADGQSWSSDTAAESVGQRAIFVEGDQIEKLNRNAGDSDAVHGEFQNP